LPNAKKEDCYEYVCSAASLFYCMDAGGDEMGELQTSGLTHQLLMRNIC